MSFFVDPKELYQWCRIPARELPGHSGLRVPFRVVKDSAEMGQLMARELAEVIEANNRRDVPTRAIVPCGPACWYLPWSRLINTKSISLKKVSIFHMDECLDWQARPLPKDHPLNFRTFMESHFYGDIRSDLNVPEEQRYWPSVATMDRICEELANQPADICVGGWGQDGHVAYNQARRHPFSHVTLDEMAQSTIHVQENNLDTIMALAHRNFGAAYQFVPPMSITLGLKECLGAAKVRVYSDTGAWKQTALRVALFSQPVAEYPITLLQKHKDAVITATQDTTRHPISENPEWDLLWDWTIGGKTISMTNETIRLSADSPYHMLAGVGGIGAGMFFELAGDHTLGRNESRPGRLLDVRDYCKLHIIAHYPAVLLGARPGGEPFGVLPIGCVGDDETGRRLCREMADAGMDVRFVRTVPNTPTLTSVCFQYPDGSGGNITTSNGAAACITETDIDQAENVLAASDGRLIALAAPEVPLEIRHYFLQSASRHGAMRVASLASAEVAAAKAMGMISLVDLLAINEDEAAAFVGAPFNAKSPEDYLQTLAETLNELHPDIRILLSAGPAGAFGFADGQWDHCPAAAVPVASTAGAGDALLGGVLSAIAAGVPFIQASRARKSFTDQPLASALDFGVLVAAMSVTSPHSIHGDACLPSVLDFARQLGAAFTGPLAKTVC